MSLRSAARAAARCPAAAVPRRLAPPTSPPLGPPACAPPCAGGGTAVVYRAADLHSGQAVALKAAQKTASHLKAAQREIQCARELAVDAPALVALLDAFT